MHTLKCILVVLCFSLSLFTIGQAERVTFALKQQNLNTLEKILWEVSDPQSPTYGHYLTVSEIAAIIQTHPDDIAAVTSWLESEGATDIVLLPSRDSLEATISTSLLQTFHKNGDYPSHLKDSIDWHFVHGQSKVFTVSETTTPVKKPIRGRFRKALISDIDDNPVGSPSAQKQSYQIPESVRADESTQQLVWGPGTYGYRASDLQQYYNEYNVNTSVDLIHAIGNLGVPGGDNFGEGTLDVTCITSMALGATTYAANTNRSNTTEEGPGFGPAFLDFVTGLAQNTSLPPLVLSLSLGSLSWDACNLLCVNIEEQGQFSYQDCLNYVQYEQRQVCMYPSANGQDRINAELMKLGTRGFSVFAATGDGGSHFSFEPFDERDPIGRALNNISCLYNMPTFPASSPYVTGVGGVQWTKPASPEAPVAWTNSGGSFSWRYPIPSYQEAAVSSYLSNNPHILPPLSSYNSSMRVYPDVAALTVNIPMVLDGQSVLAAGTSASAPTFAGIISLINSQRVAQGLPLLGFINPRLYQIDPSQNAFYDVTKGDIKTSCSSGFVAAVGWDPTTGFGSPLWPGLSASLSAAP